MILYDSLLDGLNNGAANYVFSRMHMSGFRMR